MCAITVGTFHGGNCHTSVSCSVDGKVDYDKKWSVCYKGGVQYLTDERIGDFSVQFTAAENDYCPEGLCGPVIKVGNFNNWMGIDAQEEADKTGNGGICHTGLTNNAVDSSQNSGGFWWVCGVPNL